MPIATETYPIPPFDRPVPTTEDLDWADLTELPLDLFYDPKGRAQLVESVKHALEVDDLGFWSVTNAGFSDEEIDHQFAIAQAFFNLPIEERKSNAIDAKNGGYLVYRAVSHAICFARQGNLLTRYHHSPMREQLPTPTFLTTWSWLIFPSIPMTTRIIPATTSSNPMRQ